MATRCRRACRGSTRLVLAGFVVCLAAALFVGVLLRAGRSREFAVEDAGPGGVVHAGPRVAEDGADPKRPQAQRRQEGNGHAASLRSPVPESDEQIVRGNGSLPVKVAALRHSLRPGIDPTLSAFGPALTAEADPSLRTAALGILSSIAGSSPLARRLLAEYAATGNGDAGERTRALATFLTYAAEPELRRHSTLIFNEYDPDAVAVAIRALTANPDPGAPTLAAEVGATHPGAEARHRAEEVRTGRYCPEHEPAVATE